jgi:hypothetical protein
MRHRTSIIITVAVLLSITVLLTAQETESQASKWYNLTAEQIHHSDFTLKPGESKALDISSRVPIHVGFKANMTIARVKQYRQAKKDPIRLSTRDGKLSIASSLGAAMRFTPESESIALIITNGADLRLQIVIYSEVPKPTK